jgi:hypothetical protein
MIDPNVPPVADDELLARYATHKDDFRADNSAKHTLFMPYPHQELSVTRHLNATEEEIWILGDDVVNARKASHPIKSFALYGRFDIKVCDCKQIRPLQVNPKPLPNNPNHANVEGWPKEKEQSMEIAKKLAASARKLIQRV